jgi:hypothetical protein
MEVVLNSLIEREMNPKTRRTMETIIDWKAAVSPSG